MKVSQLYLSV